MNRIWVAAALVAVIGGGATVAQANPITVFNTGQGTVGNADPNWHVCSTTAATTAPTSACAYSSASGATIVSAKSGWHAPITSTKWISVATNGSGGKGYFIYETTFNLTGFQPSTLTLNGSYYADDCIVNVFINNASIGTNNWTPSTTCSTSGDWNTLHSFVFSSIPHLNAGLNTLSFVIYNIGTGLTGFDLALSATATKAVPEPATLGLFGLGLLGLGGLWLRRRQAVA